MLRLDRLRRICDGDLDDRALRAALLGELATGVPFEAHVWLLTDPETEVGTSPLADVPGVEDLPRLIRAKYRTPLGRWTGLAAGEVVSVAQAAGGVRSASALWSAASHHGVDDIASVAFRDPFGCWGFLDLWRVGGTFSADERAVLGELAVLATPALRRCVARTFEVATVDGAPTRDGPAVIVLSDELELQTRTPQADADLRAVLPTERERAPVPASACNVAAQLLAVEAGVDGHEPTARVHLGGGEWCTFAAARLDEGDAPTGAVATIAVGVERTPPLARTELYGRALGLTERERHVLGAVVRGGDTQAIAGRLFVSPHTVQDHLKSIFAKSDVRSRPALVARATGVGPGRCSPG